MADLDLTEAEAAIVDLIGSRGPKLPFRHCALSSQYSRIRAAREVIEELTPIIERQVCERIAIEIDEECPHPPDSHAEGSCEVCDYALAVAQIVRATTGEAGQ